MPACCSPPGFQACDAWQREAKEAKERALAADSARRLALQKKEEVEAQFQRLQEELEGRGLCATLAGLRRCADLGAVPLPKLHSLQSQLRLDLEAVDGVSAGAAWPPPAHRAPCQLPPSPQGGRPGVPGGCSACCSPLTRGLSLEPGGVWKARRPPTLSCRGLASEPQTVVMGCCRAAACGAGQKPLLPGRPALPSPPGLGSPARGHRTPGTQSARGLSRALPHLPCVSPQVIFQLRAKHCAVCRERAHGGVMQPCQHRVLCETCGAGAPPCAYCKGQPLPW